MTTYFYNVVKLGKARKPCAHYICYNVSLIFFCFNLFPKRKVRKKYSVMKPVTTTIIAKL